jgi:catechol 2,3-dioxygenase-like lactoylglutathione lyase family enzyme
MGGHEPPQEKGKLTKVWMAAVPVSNIGAALEFYSGVLGLELQRRDENWAELGPQEPLAKVALYVPGKDEKRQPGGPSGVVLACDSIYDLHRKLVDQGVEFKLKPSRRSWGGLLAIFLDQDQNELVVLEHPERYRK